MLCLNSEVLLSKATLDTPVGADTWALTVVSVCVQQ